MTIITGILAKIGIGKALAALGGTIVLPFLFKTVRTRVKDALGALFRKEIDRAFHPDMTDTVKAAAFRKMVQGIVDYAEICIPDSGMGSKKLEFVKAYLMRFIPEKYADEIVAIINDVVLEMNAALKDKSSGAK